MSDGVVVTVRLTPRSSRDAIEGVTGEGVIRARVTAPPVDGAANAALIKLVARSLGVPRSRVSLVGGASSRVKRLRIAGVDAVRVETCWAGASIGGLKSR